MPSAPDGAPEGVVSCGYGMAVNGYAYTDAAAVDGDVTPLREWVEREGLRLAQESQRGASG